jgi:predicted transcriptional regulator
METIEIKIRNVDADVIAKIDRLASQKDQSREEFIRRLLRRFTDTPFMQDIVDQVEVEKLLLDVANHIHEQNEELERMLNEQK